jgi:hypothetical protein
VQLKDSEKGGEILVKEILALANLVFFIWFIYFAVEASTKLNIWPFS